MEGYASHLLGAILYAATLLPNGTDLNSSGIIGIHNINSSHPHVPSGFSYGGLVAIKIFANNIQIAFEWTPSNKVFYRSYDANSWTEWFEL